MLKHIIELLIEEVTNAYNYFDMFEMYKKHSLEMANIFVNYSKQSIERYENIKDTYKQIMLNGDYTIENKQIFIFNVERLNDIVNSLKLNLEQISK